MGWIKHILSKPHYPTALLLTAVAVTAQLQLRITNASTDSAIDTAATVVARSIAILFN